MKTRATPFEILLLYLIAVVFYHYQELFGVLGYRLFRETASVTYAFRGLLVLLTFGLPLLLLIRPPRRVLAGGVFILGAMTVAYFSWKVNGRPWVDEICDRDEALELALGRLFRGEFPYSYNTTLGGRITCLSGSLLLALPGWLAAGRAELSTILWAPLGAALLWDAARLTKREEWAAPAMAAYFWGPPMVLNLVYGSDLIWMGVALAAMWWLMARGWLLAAAVALALWLTQRTIGWVLFPATAMWVWRNHQAEFWKVCGGVG